MKMRTDSVEAFKSDFLHEFTKNMIKNTKGYYLAELELITKNKKEFFFEEVQYKTKEEIKDIIKERKKQEVEIISQRRVQEAVEIEKPAFKFQVMPKPVAAFLNIPVPRMPERFNYLRPIPTEAQIDLGVLNSLVMDRTVNAIECRGAGEKIRVKTNEIRETGIVLNAKDIDNIIQKFAEYSRIPALEGIYNVVFGRLMLSAEISSSVGTKFTITKMSAPRAPVQYGGY